MSSTFAGFSEEDLKRIKTGTTHTNNVIPTENFPVAKKVALIGSKQKRAPPQYKLSLQSLNSDDSMDGMEFEKCKLSIKTTSSPTETIAAAEEDDPDKLETVDLQENEENSTNNTNDEIMDNDSRKSSTAATPDLVKSVDNYTEDELSTHKVKLEELQLKQRIMEEQNKKRKEMLSKALADRTRQTAEEVLKLEKIKKELQVLDGQFSQDVSVLRKKIDQACLTYADAEKHYLRVEKDFLQAKINLQKEKEKKELLTEHLCALITHNETRKAQKLETLMLELATDRKNSINNDLSSSDEESLVIDGVCQKTGSCQNNFKGKLIGHAQVSSMVHGRT